MNRTRAVTVYPPGHIDGHPSAWLWEVVEAGVAKSCGTSPDADEAFECAQLAVQE